ncbi:PAS domain [Macleaya cordata]|uniref:PAS domain n=1 Tax=Macleaya cordata TaxID=56857 RepID=A0A200R7Y0_MACCD|nr:PAS domain [Macleaya cordata]
MGLGDKEGTSNNTNFPSSSAASTVKSNSNNNKNKAIAQYNADARLLTVFEQSAESGKSFDYSKYIKSAQETSVSQEEMTARSDLEPYLGLHYPSTDIPQAARFLFKQNRFRMICDCHAKPIGIIQSEQLKQPLCLVNSTLRSPHGCHTQYMANMGSIASLVMAVVVNSGNDSKTRLWGLVVCHHGSRRYIPFPLRYACEFLMQAFGLQLNMELQMAAQLAEKKILKMQTLLCDMFLRDAPIGIVTQSPNIMDLVKCDGAALYYGGMCWLLGVTPSEAQIKDIADWLLTFHRDSTGFCTDSLADAGYADAGLLGDAVCGMAAAKITSKDFLFWFRSHTAKEVKWGGAKHHPDDKDDGGRMHPRSSFKAFLEVVKCRSFPWEVSEMNAIYSLQLILRGSIQDGGDSVAKTMIHSEQNDLDMEGMMDELSSVASEMVRLIETATTPILAVDSAGLINGWNAKTAELTGLATSEAMGKSLVNELVHQESRVVVENHLSRALRGFLLGCVMDAIVSQVMILLREKNLQLIHDIPEKIKMLSLYGDQIRLQQVLSDFLLNVVHHAPSPGGWVEIKVTFNLKLIEDGIELVHLDFRMTHPGQGLPSEVVQDMFEEGTQSATQEGLSLSMSRKLLRMMNGHVQYIKEPTRMTHPGQGLPSEVVQDMFEEGTQSATQEGLSLSMSRKLLRMMNGHVQYIKEPTRCYFLIEVEFQTTQTQKRCKQS